MSIYDTVDDVVNWRFLDEPLYRWALFVAALAAIGFGWRQVLDLMK